MPRKTFHLRAQPEKVQDIIDELQRDLLILTEAVRAIQVGVAELAVLEALRQLDEDEVQD